MTEKSGIQMIEEILGNMTVLDRRIQIIEQLLKQLLTVANTQPKKEPEKPQIVQATIEGVVPEPLIKAAPNARAIGRIVEDSKPVPEVNITIYDDKNNPIKKTRTNRSGEWMAQLPPGKYMAECLLEGRINGNVTFNVGQGDKIVRVGQPQ